MSARGRTERSIAPAAASTPRAVTFGELMLRLSPPGDERLFSSELLRAGFGGAEANVAVGLAHLGVRADYVTRLPDNLIGDEALRVLRAEGVGIDSILRGAERMGVYFVEPGADLRESRLLYDRAGSAFARVEPDTFDWPALLRGAQWFHGTGITPALGAGPAGALTAAVSAAHAANARVSLDLNYRPALWQARDPRPLIEPLARGTSLIFANALSAHAMLGIDADERPPESLEETRALCERIAERTGCALVALTRREVVSHTEHVWSAVLYEASSGTLNASRKHRVRVVDRLGGGDSFAAALIMGMIHGRASGDALEFAVAASAHKLAVPGDFNRATVEEIERLVALPESQ
jgi:2-dehydro-3-deoxygluconokinase